ncbi:MAG: EAL domain-containing protein [Natronospirillum sp.]|uniref:EAL domain-containing response regulator n=1 Tax=Natronospirillum sp. TaxID=2812955 RepID=UPI0025DFE0A3|nr:EAL domain-containing protein [Natronospirillum sp.]MCH8550691.1 EAL domain-containing protein [Natronospirillum sp.]
MNADASISQTSKKAALTLLMLHHSQNEAEPLISELRNAGQATHSQFVASPEELEKLLTSQVFDVACVHLESENVPAQEAIRHLQSQGRDIPIVAITSDITQRATVEQAIALGVEDVVAEDFMPHFRHAILRAHRQLLVRRRRRELEHMLNESERRCQLLLEGSRDAIAYVHEGMHIYANEAYRELFGYDDMEELSCMPLVDLVQTEKPQQLKNELKKVSKGEQAHFQANGQHESGESFEAVLDLSAASWEGEPCLQIVIRKSGVDAAALQAKVQEMASYDAHTNLHNRAYFDSKLDAIMGETGADGPTPVLGFLQVTNFADLKTELGIAGADLALAQVADMLREAYQEARVVARFLDDVFTLICTGPLAESATACEKTVKRINDHLFDVGGKTAQVRLHAGLVNIDETSATASEVVTRAHETCQLASREKRPVQVWQPGAASSEENTISSQVREALDNDGLRILFQPILNLRRGSEENYEVLVRLVDNDDLIEPQHFLDAADVADLSSRLDRWVLQHTVAQLARHRRGKSSRTRAFVHLTAASVQDPTFLPWANKVLREAKLPGDAIVFQVSERIAQSYLKMMKAFTKGIGVLHAGLAIVHFGNQGDSNTLFRHLKIDYVKVDPGFVQDLSQDSNMDRLGKLLSVIHEQEAASIVPHIETASILGNLWPLGVHYVQGYYLQAPAQSMDFAFEDDDD